MNSQNGNGWPPSSGPGAPPSLNNEHSPAQQRQIGSFGSNHPLHQNSSSLLGAPSIVPHSAPFYSSQANGHVLSNPATLSQASPNQSTRGPNSSQQQHSPTSIQNHQISASGYALPGIGQAMQHQQSSPTAITLERERDRERDMERDRQRQHEMVLQREYERELELRDQQQQQLLLQQQQQLQQQPPPQQHEQHRSPRETHTSSIPLQHPVASRVPATLHGPNGLLGPQHPASGVPSNMASAPLGAPAGPGNIFGNGAQPTNEASPRPFMRQAPPSIPPQQLLGFGNSVGPQQLPSGMAALSQGQQPILNDALSYLDQVKVRFMEHPDVYNRFLDIMKDFKSQTIDTPGVIDRVSTLFTGHPELIQGFNTFLPPGYHIECGTGDDPNAIRVTTPMGTTVSQMPSLHSRPNGVVNGAHTLELGGQPGPQPAYRDGIQPNSEWPQQQQDNPAPVSENPFSSGGRHGALSLFSTHANSGQSNGVTYDRDEQPANSDAATIAHQQEQRGVSNLSNAVSVVATNEVQSRPSLAQISPSAEQAPGLSQMASGIGGVIGSALASGNQLGMEKRGPVEFNHAIGYVNKIKNRFSLQPEIYKQFLEILQTYQRESKPIQDVYAQVTQLFNSAPDLLEDFKQFLPESAAQAKAQAAARQATEDATMLSNVRSDNSYLTGMQHTQAQTPRPEMKMPPVGNFAPPPSVGKENKKRRGGAGSQITGGAAAVDSGLVSIGQTSKNGTLRGSTGKRARIEPPKPSAPEIPPISPSLVPSLPIPLAPTVTPSAMSEELTFFDRVKKYLNNKQTFNDFLKLCNLFSHDLIDKNHLYHKALQFIGTNPDLLQWLRSFIKYDGDDVHIENRPKIGGDKVVLSNCRGLGPSYRMLPKREKLRHCSGRDDMCQSVLNDEWVSHPTWASEDSGFIAHRKNSFEEILHRIEEERHDYDFNIEACTRTIQLMEPIMQQINLMSEEDRKNYVLPPGIGGQSETIYERVIKKIYDRVHGQAVIIDMFKHPVAVIPLLLHRLKVKLEEWKSSQREWEKVWRDQTNKLFWRSLDHQGINSKSDKRQFQPKVLLTEIQAKSEEQRRQSISKWNIMPKYQFLYHFDDVDVIQDTCHLILIYLHHSYGGNGVDQSRLENFIKTVIPTFFDLDGDSFQRRMSDVYDATPPNEEAEDDTMAVEDQTVGRGRRAVNGRKGNLLRGVLERGQPGKSGPKEKEDNGLPQSKETTPDMLSVDEDAPTSTETPTEQPTRVDSAEHRWMEHPATGNSRNRQDINHNEPFKRDHYNLYASVNIYCFFRMFEMIYGRLVHIKDNEKAVHETVRRSKMNKPAYDLRLIDKKPSDYFTDVGPNADFYRQILRMCEEVIKGDNDANQLEDTLRQFYLQKGWQLFSLDKMIAALLRFGLQILVSDNKDKSLDIINLFYKDRRDVETTHQAELTYRKQVEKLVKDGDIFRIRYIPSTKEVTIAIFKKDDKTFELDEMADTARWSYYISTFSLRDMTEGIDIAKIRWPFLKRNLAPLLDTEEDYSRVYEPQWNADNLVIRISPNNYHMQYDPNTQDWWVHDKTVRRRGMLGMDEAKEDRKARFRNQFVVAPTWMAEKTEEQIENVNADFRRWVNGGEGVSTEGATNAVQDAAPVET